MRNAGLAVLRGSDVTKIAAALRHLAAIPQKAIDLVKKFRLKFL